MNITDSAITILIVILPLLVIFERDIRTGIRKILYRYKVNKKGLKNEESSPERMVCEKLPRVHEVQEVAPLNCYEEREIIKINDSYHAVEKDNVEEGDLVYVSSGRGIRSLKLINPPGRASDIEFIGSSIYEREYGRGYTKIATMAEEDIRGRYKFAK